MSQIREDAGGVIGCVVWRFVIYEIPLKDRPQKPGLGLMIGIVARIQMGDTNSILLFTD